MDEQRFDDLSRVLGDAATRRAGLKAVLAAVLGGVAAIAALEERAAADKDRSRGPEADKRKRRKKKCTPECAAGQTCVKGACVCGNGGIVCGAACCLIGQRCEGRQCVELPAPDACIAYGEPCKGVGRRCCAGLVCGSGQGGQDDVGCYVQKTGACTDTAECTFGTRCEDGICTGIPQPTPVPPPPSCVADGASGCTDAADCCTQGSICDGGVCVPAPQCSAANCDGLCCSGSCVALENLQFRNLGSFGSTEFGCCGPTYAQSTPDGLTVYVAGYTSNDVTVWTRPSIGGTWQLTATLGSSSDFSSPYGLAVSADQKSLYIANGNRISVWTRPSTADHTGWSELGRLTTNVSQPKSVWLSPDGQTMAVGNRGNNNVLIFVPDSALTPPWREDAQLGAFGTDLDKLKGPYGAFCNVTADECLVSDTGNKRISVWTKAAGGWSATTTATAAFCDANYSSNPATCSAGTAAGQFGNTGPYQGYLSPGGTTYWGLDPSNNRITAYRQTNGAWAPVVALGCAGALTGACPGGSGASDLSFPEGMYTSIDTGEIFVSDSGNNRVSIWTGCPV